MNDNVREFLGRSAQSLKSAEIQNEAPLIRIDPLHGTRIVDFSLVMRSVELGKPLLGGSSSGLKFSKEPIYTSGTIFQMQMARLFDCPVLRRVSCSSYEEVANIISSYSSGGKRAPLLILNEEKGNKFIPTLRLLVVAELQNSGNAITNASISLIVALVLEANKRGISFLAEFEMVMETILNSDRDTPALIFKLAIELLDRLPVKEVYNFAECSQKLIKKANSREKISSSLLLGKLITKLALRGGVSLSKLFLESDVSLEEGNFSPQKNFVLIIAKINELKKKSPRLDLFWVGVASELAKVIRRKLSHEECREIMAEVILNTDIRTLLEDSSHSALNHLFVELGYNPRTALMDLLKLANQKLDEAIRESTTDDISDGCRSKKEFLVPILLRFGNFKNFTDYVDMLVPYRGLVKTYASSSKEVSLYARGIRLNGESPSDALKNAFCQALNTILSRTHDSPMKVRLWHYFVEAAAVSSKALSTETLQNISMISSLEFCLHKYMGFGKDLLGGVEILHEYFEISPSVTSIDFEFIARVQFGSFKEAFQLLSVADGKDISLEALRVNLNTLLLGISKPPRDAIETNMRCKELLVKIVDCLMARSPKIIFHELASVISDKSEHINHFVVELFFTTIFKTPSKLYPLWLFMSLKDIELIFLNNLRDYNESFFNFNRNRSHIGVILNHEVRESEHRQARKVENSKPHFTKENTALIEAELRKHDLGLLGYIILKQLLGFPFSTTNRNVSENVGFHHTCLRGTVFSIAKEKLFIQRRNPALFFDGSILVEKYRLKQDGRIVYRDIRIKEFCYVTEYNITGLFDYVLEKLGSSAFNFEKAIKEGRSSGLSILTVSIYAYIKENSSKLEKRVKKGLELLLKELLLGNDVQLSMKKGSLKEYAKELAKPTNSLRLFDSARKLHYTQAQQYFLHALAYQRQKDGKQLVVEQSQSSSSRKPSSVPAILQKRIEPSSRSSCAMM